MAVVEADPGGGGARVRVDGGRRRCRWNAGPVDAVGPLARGPPAARHVAAGSDVAAGEEQGQVVVRQAQHPRRRRHVRLRPSRASLLVTVNATERADAIGLGGRARTTERRDEARSPRWRCEHRSTATQAATDPPHRRRDCAAAPRCRLPRRASPSGGSSLVPPRRSRPTAAAAARRAVAQALAASFSTSSTADSSTSSALAS